MPGKQSPLSEKQRSCSNLLGFINKTWTLQVSLRKPRTPCFHLVLPGFSYTKPGPVAKDMSSVPNLS
jgi:hypothetical protein